MKIAQNSKEKLANRATEVARKLPQLFQILPRDLVMVFQSRKNGVKSSLNFERFLLCPWAKIKNFEAWFCRSALLLSFCENRFRLLRFIKKLNPTKRGAFFRLFCVSKVTSIAHAHTSGVIFYIFPRHFKQTKLSSCNQRWLKKPPRGPALIKISNANKSSFRHYSFAA